MTLDWNRLVFGSYSHAEVKLAVSDTYWQLLRYTLLDEDLETKYRMLARFVDSPSPTPVELRKIAVTNYVHALARGGLIPPMEERK